MAGAMATPDAAFDGPCVNARWVAVPAVMSNAELMAPVKPVAVAERVYPLPALSMEALLKVATPLTGDTLATVPDSVPPFGFVPIASEIWFVAEVTRLLRASRISTWIAGAIDAPDTALVG